MLLRIVSILFPLFAIVAVGYVVGKRARPDLSHANKLNMDVFVPALVFAALASKPFRPENDIPLLLATLAIVIGSGLNFAIRSFKLVPTRPAFDRYLDRCVARPAFQRAETIAAG